MKLIEAGVLAAALEAYSDEICGEHQPAALVIRKAASVIVALDDALADARRQMKGGRGSE